MLIKVLFFGITSDLLETSNLDLDIKESSTVLDFKSFIKEKYPQLKNINSYAIAVNDIFKEAKSY